MKNPLRDCLGLALSLVLIVAVGSCAQDPPAGALGGTAFVGLSLQVGPTVVITSADYAIVINNIGFTSAGTVPVGNSADLPIPIAGLAIANGYRIAVVANAADGITICRGTTGFDVRANSRSTVVVHLVCREPPRTGSAQIGGTLNVCPLLDGLSASPDQVIVGGTASLTTTAHDADGTPQPLTYLWSATAGTLSSTTAASPTFTCTQAGIATITVRISDGDADPSCADQLHLTVNCKVAP
jgi:hypothetical protein